MPLWGSVIVALGIIGTYLFGLVVVAFSLPDDPSGEQIAYACFWPLYPGVRLVVVLGRLAARLGRSIRARREIPTARLRSDADATKDA